MFQQSYCWSNKFVAQFAQNIPLRHEGEPVWASFVVSVFDLLHHRSDTDLKELVHVARRNR